MSTLKTVRTILKILADDTRLRIVNILNTKELNVAEMCEILHAKQSIISKHLTKLRFTGIVVDRREGQFIYYSLNKSKFPFLNGLMDYILKEVSDLEKSKQDVTRLRKLNNNS
jgi:ArsR family transcriptional regulator